MKSWKTVFYYQSNFSLILLIFYILRKMNTWTVIKFTSDNSVEAVPTKWLSENNCAWPKYTREKLQKAIRTCEPALPSWEAHKISTFRNATYDDYTVARKKCQRAEVTSDINSDLEKRWKNPLKLVSSSESGSDIDSCSENNISVLPKLPDININLGNASSFNGSGVGSECQVSIERNVLQKDSLKNKNKSSIPERINSDVLSNCECCPHHRYDQSNTGLIKQIIRKLSIIEMSVTEIRSRLDSVEQVGMIEEENIWEQFELPLKDSEGFTIFEEYLSSEENIKKSIKQLSMVGGDTSYEFVRRAMAKLMTNRLASEFSWMGLKKKLVFSKTHTSDLVIRSAKINTKTKENSTKDAEDGLKKVLRRAKERFVAEEKRYSKIME